MKKLNSWKKHHRFQKRAGWCGPAVIQMILAKVGRRVSQADIAKDVYKDWWGTSQQMILAYLSRFFKHVNYKENASFSDISEHLNKGDLIIVNWWDDYDENEPGGHYSVVADYDSSINALVLADPSNERPGIWTVHEDEFRGKWYDSLDVHDKKWIEGWMLWVDPTSVIEDGK